MTTVFAMVLAFFTVCFATSVLLVGMVILPTGMSWENLPMVPVMVLTGTVLISAPAFPVYMVLRLALRVVRATSPLIFATLGAVAGAVVGLALGYGGETAAWLKVLAGGPAGALVGFLVFLLERRIMQCTTLEEAQV